MSATWPPAAGASGSADQAARFEGGGGGAAVRKPAAAADVAAAGEDAAWAVPFGEAAPAAAPLQEASGVGFVGGEEEDDFADFAEAEPPANPPLPEAAAEAEAAAAAQEQSQPAAPSPAEVLQHRLADLSFLLSSEIC
ncbi:hypothetical protein ABPG75_001030 [Micractinium tetrahymenae]